MKKTNHVTSASLVPIALCLLPVTLLLSGCPTVEDNLFENETDSAPETDNNDTDSNHVNETSADTLQCNETEQEINGECVAISGSDSQSDNDTDSQAETGTDSQRDTETRSPTETGTDTQIDTATDTATERSTEESVIFVPVNPDDTTGLTPIGDDGLAGTTHGYWDCCKPSCAWSTATTSPAVPAPACHQDNSYFSNAGEAQDACNGGDAYTCWSMAPWQVNTRLAYGFAKANTAAGAIECGECIQMEFDGDLAGKSMVVQIVGTGGDTGSFEFDILVPGAGVGMFNACASQWGASNSELGHQYGGFFSACAEMYTTELEGAVCANAMCEDIFDGRDDLKNGCLWFTQWLHAHFNPSMYWKKIPCPEALTDVSGME